MNREKTILKPILGIQSGEGVVIRRTSCKTVLNRTSISDYSLNCYTGCAHGCRYCYARFMQRFHPHPEPWGRFVDIKANAVEVLKRQLHHAVPGAVFVSSACDGWQPIEAEYKLTRQCCDLLLKQRFRIEALTKSSLVLRDLDIFSGRDVRIGVTITTLNERLKRLWEPNSSSIEERFGVISKSGAAGLETAIMFGPLLPFLSDNQESIDSMFHWAAELAVDIIWVDALNPRPKVWSSVASLLRKKFPDLVERYRQVLFDYKSRADYLSELRYRVTNAVRKFSLTDKVNVCF
jgi:DNA repair photolyase